MPDNAVVAAIKNDHRTLERMFDQLRKNPDEKTLAEMSILFVAHGKAEEAEVYPKLAVKSPEDKGDVFHGVEEHREAEEHLRALQAAEPGTEDFTARLEKFVESVDHHVEEEESSILPELNQALTEDEAARVAEAFHQAEEAEKTRLAATSGRDLDAMSKEELVAQAERQGLTGVSSRTKDELKTELHAALNPKV
ncbi:hemerythrin domain-containing protein [Actinomadura kijaniata]|uniref:hemerythrin domain-containing protein n=1 Tax=Actinomadura kijaniata TaxID=46161 RepID=UPI0008313658|nr:hemerythrin domain-containing protein [Actinomadura kijaniata]